MPPEIAATLESCLANAGVLPQPTESDVGYHRRLQCHTAYLREEHAEVYEEIVGLVARACEARACAAIGVG